MCRSKPSHNMKQKNTLLDPTSSSTVSLPDETTFSDKGIVSRGVLSTATLRVTLFGFADGQELTEHASSSRALIQILSGSSEWTVDGHPMMLTAGHVLHLPPGTRHAVYAREAFSMLLTLVKEAEGVSTPPPAE
jgi:quercetin dioxygenase-like cupin family protein